MENSVKTPGRLAAQAIEKNEFEPGSISLPSKLWRILERLQHDRSDSSLSTTIRVLLLERLAEKQYLSQEEKKALGL